MQSVPNKPFMIVLGTSHTNGDCEEGNIHLTTLKNGKEVRLVQKTAYQRVAEELGLEIVQIGLSGCSNIDLLEATNELSSRGFLNDNCKLFILEPRCVDNTVKLPQEFFEDLPNKDWVLRHELTSILEGWGVRRGHDNKGKPPAIQQISQEVNVIHHKDYTRYPEANSMLIQKASEVHIFSAGTTMHLYEHLVQINAIKNIVMSNNINFKWQTWNIQDIERNIGDYIIDSHSSLFDHFIGEIAPLGTDKKLFCSCGHYNEDGHIHWYNSIIDRVKLRMK